MKRLHLFCSYLACLAVLPLWAQNTTNLPTSMYGIGELSAGDGGRLAGMGHVGIALNRPGFANTQNPAGITQMDTTCFTFDVGASAAYARYGYLSDHSSSMTGNPNRISLGFRVMKRWYMMLGAAPYSAWAISSAPRNLWKDNPTRTSTLLSKAKGASTGAILQMPYA